MKESKNVITNYNPLKMWRSFGYKTCCLLLLAVVYSCSSVQKEAPITVSVTDGTGRVIEIKNTPKTVMALSPSMTEVLFDLGLEERIVGRTDQCDYPDQCLKLPKVQVYPTVDIEKVLQLHPDVIVSNAGITPPETAEKLTSLGIPVLLYDIHSIAELYRSIKSIAKVLSVKERGELIVSRLEKEVENKKVASDKKTCFALVSIDPVYVHGKTSFLNEVLNLAGFENSADSSLGAYPQLSREYLLKKDSEYLIGYDFAGLDTTFFELYPELKNLKAYQNKTIISLDHDLASRPSPRFVNLFDQLSIKEE